MADMKPEEREEAFFCGCGWEGRRSQLHLPGGRCPSCGSAHKLVRKIGG
jgi:predicted Zn-ribbon and HTH transcriptional regulator